ncbi:hypothetical protein [Palleronia caenipelagi]|uniref:Uncharacterized protein n=1 Tax=Palleronia caenipelagi TaxID=2489174 RepID=A0A547Q8F7_9RHOB|nr:hypothetical protein [Palleronia caenipelagi]TRD22668.1 hypothetical protein FEV53_04445 [Palleronia caenipelagi]
MSKFSSKIALSAIALVAVAGAASATETLSRAGDSFVEYAKAGSWTIYANESRDTCLAEKVGSNGDVIQVGMTDMDKLGYMGIFTQSDIDLVDGEPIVMTVNGNTYSADAIDRDHGLSGDYQGGYFRVSNAQLVEDIKAGQTLTAFETDGEEGVLIDLTGTNDAINAGAACTASFNS